MASGEYNRKHNKKIHRPCPVCGSRVIVANHGGTWWVACDADRTHIKQVFFHEPIDAIRWWNARTNGDRIRAMTDEKLAKFISDKARTFGEEYEGYMSALDWLKEEVEE